MSTSDVLTLDLPNRTYGGAGTIRHAGEAARNLGARSIFVVTDPVLTKTDCVDRLLLALDSRTVQVRVCDAAEPEPTISAIEAVATALYEAGDIDLVVSLGGGSVIDVAKCANVVATNGGDIVDYESGAVSGRQIARLLPHIAIPTTAGTGSEATVWAIYVDPSRRLKSAVSDSRLIPDVAILDAELTTTLPKRVTAGTGMDALTHAIEAYVSAFASPFTDAFAAQAIRLIAANLRRAFAQGQDIVARSNMLTASFMAGAAFSNSSCGLVHTLAETVGGFFRTPHGVTNALLLPWVMEFNLDACPEKFANVAALLGENVTRLNPDEACRAAILAVKNLNADIGLPPSLREIGVKRVDIPALSREALVWADTSGNPKAITLEQITHLYEAAF